ncbi:MAG: hypothetical protein IPM29_21195 [Planctomycetes bacterium]|nr:hypothetical protein [Planctomycetota bacterium]
MTRPDPLDPTADTRALALAAAADFSARQLPGLVRRLLAWKRLPHSRAAELASELGQEVCVDALEHAGEVSALSDEQLAVRFMRVAQRAAYRLALRPTRHEEPSAVPLDERPAPECGPDAGPTAGPFAPHESQRALLESIAARGVRLCNGRLSTTRTARLLGVDPRRVRGAWLDTAERLGYGDEHQHFWVRRLAEALTAMAAARLVASGRLRVWDAPLRRRPDPDAESRRLGRIRSALEVRPQVGTVRSVLARVAPLSRRARPTLTPDELLDLAAALRPGDAATALWRFEAAVAAGATARAERALRDAEAAGAEPVRLLLARARLCELRGEPEVAARLLTDTDPRTARDPRVLASRDALLARPHTAARARRHAASARRLRSAPRRAARG